ncbi:MAG: LysR substrate-binding domain-containing protein [Burkholderiales bacterium]
MATLPMELRHLRYFIAVAEERSFTRAAVRLGIQQPPLSQQVQALEYELRMKLFERLPRGVELTPGGAVFLEEARAVLAGLDRGASRALRTADGQEGAISVGFTSSVTAHRLAPEIIRTYRYSYPNVALDFHEGNAADLTEAVTRSELDAAIVRAPVAQPAELVFHCLLDEELLIALPVKHPLALQKHGRAQRGLSLTALANEPFILVRRPGAPGMYANLIAACNQLGFSPRIAAQVGHMLTNIMLVAAGVGVSAVPASMRDTHTDSVAYRDLVQVPRLIAPITLIHRREETNPAASRFIAITKRLARKFSR